VFSFKAKITPLSLLNDASGGMSISKCKVKMALPFKIYSSEKDTKDGYEFFINSKGTFFRQFSNVLFKKSK
jgi:hypothetical protein